MAQKLVTVKIDQETADVSIDASGFKGKGCAEVMKAFDSLGKVTKEVKKPEYYDSPNQGHNTITAGR